MKVIDYVSYTPTYKHVVVGLLDAAIHTLILAAVFTMILALYAIVA